MLTSFLRILVVCALGVAGTITGHPPAALAAARHTVGAVPSNRTPQVRNGAVNAIAQAGSTIVLGGTFNKIISSGGTKVLSRPHLVAFDAATGKVSRTFRPRLNGSVLSLEAAADGKSVFVSGSFTRVDGHPASHLVRLRIATGEITHGFRAPGSNGSIATIALTGNTLYAGGQFRTVGGKRHGGLAAFNASTGAVRKSLALSVRGEHGAASGATPGRVGVHDLDVSPNGSRLVVIGNFTAVGGLPRQQIAMISLGRRAKVVTSWATRRFNPRCGVRFATYMRSVAFSPGGTYFAIVTTGGRSTSAATMCDSASRWETRRKGKSLSPTWVAKTGSDTLLSVDISSAAVYVGGHQRWLNNPDAKNRAGPGAVPRPGIAALDPVSGMPLRWNPGRNPRGFGTSALLVTRTGLWVGSDTDWIGNRKYKRKRIAFFSLAEGSPLPLGHLGGLPGNVYQFGAMASPDTSVVNKIAFTGRTTTSVTQPAPLRIRSWSHMRGAMMIDKTLFYGWSNGMLYRRQFLADGFGPASRVDPYHNKTWRGVKTGSGNSTYDGVRPDFYRQLPHVTGMFYVHGRLYYSLSTSPSLRWVAFSTDSGIVGQTQHVVTSRFDWRKTAGLFKAGDTLYLASKKTGRLSSLPFSAGNRIPGRAKALPAASRHRARWASRGLVVYVGSVTP